MHFAKCVPFKCLLYFVLSSLLSSGGNALCERSLGDFLSLYVSGSDPGVHQTPGPAGGHEPPVRYSPEADAAVPHLNATLNSLW